MQTSVILVKFIINRLNQIKIKSCIWFITKIMMICFTTSWQMQSLSVLPHLGNMKIPKYLQAKGFIYVDTERSQEVKQIPQ